MTLKHSKCSAKNLRLKFKCMKCDNINTNKKHSEYNVGDIRWFEGYKITFWQIRQYTYIITIDFSKEKKWILLLCVETRKCRTVLYLEYSYYMLNQFKIFFMWFDSKIATTLNPVIFPHTTHLHFTFFLFSRKSCFR